MIFIRDYFGGRNYLFQEGVRASRLSPSSCPPCVISLCPVTWPNASLAVKALPALVLCSVEKKNSSGSLTASKRREQWKHRYGSASPDGNRRFRGHRPGLAGCICTRGHPKKIYEPSVHPDQNTHLRGFCYLNYIQGKEDETVSHRVSPRGGGIGRGRPPPGKGVLGQPPTEKRIADNLHIYIAIGCEHLIQR